MNATPLIEPTASDGAPDTSSSASRLLDQLQGGLPPLLSVVPQAGPPVFVYTGLGLVLLLLLVRHSRCSSRRSSRLSKRRSCWPAVSAATASPFRFRTSAR